MKKVKDIKRKLSVEIDRNYRMVIAFGNLLGVYCSSLSKKTQAKPTKRHQISEKVQCFLEREDNCGMLPGKRGGKDKTQKAC